MRTYKILSATLILGMALVIQSCVKPATEEKFGPLPSKSCSDGILNQGEYFTDCGGPCAPCAINTFVNYKVVDSTWIDPNTPGVQVNSNWDTTLYNGNLITINAREGALFYSLTFTIDKTWTGGVHEIDSFSAFDGFIGQGLLVPMEKGVVKITNVDEVNGYVSGEFSFNCKADTSLTFFGKRISILEGEFKDIPTIPGL